VRGSRAARRGLSGTRLRALVLFAESAENATLSYQRGWPRALAADPALDCELVNVLDGRALRRIRLATRFGRLRWDVVVLLHSTFSNGPTLPPAAVRGLARARAPKVVFLGNEYKLMPEKLRFVEKLGAGLLVSQLASEQALDLYRESLDCTVISIPNTGVDLDRIPPLVARGERPVDIGYRAYDSPLYLGHRERRDIAERVGESARRRGLVTDVSLDPAQRLDEAGWLRFLASCKGQLGTEAGGDYFELDDSTRTAVNAYLEREPQASFADVHARFFATYERPVSGRALSGRIVEAAATRTVQLLLRGEYGGYFRAHEHYIPLDPGLEDVDAALDAFADEELCAELVERAHAVVVDSLTYPRLVARLRTALEALLQ